MHPVLPETVDFWKTFGQENQLKVRKLSFASSMSNSIKVGGWASRQGSFSILAGDFFLMFYLEAIEMNFMITAEFKRMSRLEQKRPEAPAHHCLSCEL